MLKKLLILAFAGLLSPAYAAGTVPGFSLAQQQDSNGTPLVGCRLYVIQAGTTATPQNPYQDSGLTIPLSNPVICDAYGRLPQIFLADGSIKLRLTKSNGTQVFVADGILVVGASSGGGGGSPVDATTIFQTGDVMWLDVDGIRTGWVRDNGRTIGSATSGATERANADTVALYTFLWNTYSNTVCPVSGGRGASAAADFAANKTIGTPNKQGLVVGGSDGMGNTASSVWASIPVVSGSVTTAGSVIGETLNTLVAGNLPPYTPAGSISGTTAPQVGGNPSAFQSAQGGGALLVLNYSSGSFVNPTVTATFTGTAQGGTSTAFGNVSKTVLGTFYRKL